MIESLKGHFIFCTVVILSIIIFRLFIRDRIIEYLEHFGRDDIKSDLLFSVVFSFIEFILRLFQYYDTIMVDCLIMYIISVIVFYTFKYMLFGRISDAIRVFLVKNFSVLFDDVCKEE